MIQRGAALAYDRGPVTSDYLQTPLQFLKGVGPRKAADLKRAGLRTVEDLLFRFPLRYEDRSQLQPIRTVKPGQTVAISGEVLHASLQTTRRAGFRLFAALIQDASGQIQAVWPNQAFLKDVIRAHQHVVLYGKAEHWGSRGLQITDPEFEVIRDGEPRRDDDAAHRPHRPGLRTHGERDDEHAAAAGLGCARRASG
jgi:ATP-dependent DNA helicase RecG